ncbi:MAG: hypothetical protein N4A62_05275 [Marinisporobacter sp.]|jgi:type IV secretory pathway TrbL component|nr:hypothetical protein [Marinisporobacter sp.]
MLARVINAAELMILSLIVSLACILVAFKANDEHKILRNVLLVINFVYVGIFGLLVAIVGFYGKP